MVAIRRCRKCGLLFDACVGANGGMLCPACEHAEGDEDESEALAEAKPRKEAQFDVTGIPVAVMPRRTFEKRQGKAPPKTDMRDGESFEDMSIRLSVGHETRNKKGKDAQVLEIFEQLTTSAKRSQK